MTNPVAPDRSALQRDKLQLESDADEPTVQDQGRGMTPEEIDAFLNEPIEPSKGTSNG